jgi:hypothetical protein
MDKLGIENHCNEVLFCSKKEWSTDICNIPNEPETMSSEIIKTQKLTHCKILFI